MARAVDVARHLLTLAASEEEPDFLTHLRLQKLLYYVQGWSLVVRDRTMFSERIEAWAHGPVVRDVYPVFSVHGYGPIMSDSMTTESPEIDAPCVLDDEERDLIGRVWEVYKGYSANRLRAMTHEEPPWRDARGNCAPADRCNTEITREAMKRYFDTLASD